MENPQLLPSLLHAHRHTFLPVLGVPLNAETAIAIDCSDANPALQHIDLNDTAALRQWIDAQRGERIGYGGYGERRAFYRVSPIFSEGATDRCVHLGIDLWAEAGRPVFVPFGGSIHSFQNNNKYRDYGPTVILEHQLRGHNFFTLYGHLSETDLGSLREGLYLSAGERIGHIGSAGENGGWPPHLHFQIIADLLGRSGDYPGVSTEQEAAESLLWCPDGMLMLV